MPQITKKSSQLAEQLLDLIKQRNTGQLHEAGFIDLHADFVQVLDGAGYVGEGVETKRVVILLSDIRGFSEIAEAYPASEVVGMLNRYFAAMGDIIVNYGGSIDKLMGDSILVTFGLPDSREDDVQRCISCAVEMQLAMGKFNEENLALNLPAIYMGIGINCGEVVVGALGSEHYSEYTIIGEEVNLTSRIEAHCLRGQILISEQTLGLAKDYIEVGPPNSVEVKGAREPVNLYEVYSISSPKAMKVPRREGRKSPRVAVQMPVTFQCLAGKIILPDKIKGQVIDISYGGMLIESDIRLAPLSEIKMKISLEMFSDETTDIFARIIKSEQQGSNYLSSMEFTFVDQTGQTAIKNLVDRLVLTL
ncbi:MAG: PilZ domain-containing protein [Pseudomonadales bacterium]|nr:PilZ domain-containing protein [Pseudomonadales bacterium]